MGARELKHEVQLRGWREKVMECGSSGMSVKKWCEERRIDRKTYYRWEKEILEKASQQLGVREQTDGPTFVEVREGLRSERIREGAVAARLYTALGSLDIYAGADRETLRAVLEALKDAE